MSILIAKTGRPRLPRFLTALMLIAPSMAGAGQDPPDARQLAVRAHVRALEAAGNGTLDEATARFDAERFSPGFLARTPPAERLRLIDAVRHAGRDVDEARLGRRGDVFVLTLAGRRTAEVVFTLQVGPPFKIDSLTVGEAAAAAPEPSPPAVTFEGLPGLFDRLEREGLAGAVYVKVDQPGNPAALFEQYFGVGNAALGVKVQRDTIFATGSFPIELTVASVLLLEQRGKLSLDDRLDRFLADVPAGKRSMTIRHLLSGRSGLPDFFHEAADWDPDLAWIDRVTAERRILALPLRFTPGTEQEHSHAAFGLLAAIVEHVSGEPYQAFVRRNLLEPAGMTRTGFNGESKGLGIGDFAVGHGPSSTGVPNIPPNWGPTSWLVMGSGGMYSTLTDLTRFYTLMRSGQVLDASRSARFHAAKISQDGSDHGFELFHAYNPAGGEAFLLVNASGPGGDRRQLFQGLTRLVGLGGPR